MKKIYKYPIGFFSIREQEKVISLPKGAQILEVNYQNQHDDRDFFVWALIDPLEKETEDHSFRVLATGEPFTLDTGYDHIGTRKIVQYGIETVWHLFYKKL